MFVCLCYWYYRIPGVEEGTGGTTSGQPIWEGEGVSYEDQWDQGSALFGENDNGWEEYDDFGEITEESEWWSLVDILREWTEDYSQMHVHVHK